MSASLKIVLLLACIVALVYVTFKLILPLIALYTGGLGIEIPIPVWFGRAFPRLTIYAFVIGGPLLFAALVATLIWLARFQPRH
jgi:hypothetical protein